MSGAGVIRSRNCRLPCTLAVSALLLIHYALALSGVRLKSPTFDETAHITAGYSFWRLNDYRLQPENGNLPQRLAALPLVLSGSFTFPGRDQAAWRESDVWTVGGQFFYLVGNDLKSLLWRSRAGMAVLGTALCLTVFLWARSLYGTAGGLIALVLCACSPIILANGPLATSDICAALFFLLSLRSLWALLHRITLPHTLACAAAISGLAISKTSAILFIPMAALLVPSALLRSRELVLALPGFAPLTIRRASRRLAALVGVVAICGLVAWSAIWVAFGCRYSPIPPGEEARFAHYLGPGIPVNTLEGITAIAGIPGRLVALAGSVRLFPEAFLYGTAYVFASAHHYEFFNGELSTEGWPLFFPYCFLVKSTLPLLALCATALVLPLAATPRGPTFPAAGHGAARGPGHWIPASMPLWILLVVFWPSLIFSTINIGARHMLPVYPALFILAGSLARWWGTTWIRWWLVVLLCWHAAEGLRGFPHYLAYFNQIVGRQHAYRHLVDSSLDWGQDLPGLKSWLDQRRSREPRLRAYLSYFGTGDPAYYGILAEPIELQERWQRGLPPLGEAGVYCVSATNLQRVYDPVRGRWNSRFEEAYQSLSRSGGPTGPVAAGTLKWIEEDAGDVDRETLLRHLGSARFIAALREREPDHTIGYSILCYELSQADVERAFSGPPPETRLPKAPGSKDHREGQP